MDHFISNYSLDTEDWHSHLACCNDIACALAWWNITYSEQKKTDPPITIKSKEIIYLITFTHDSKVSKSFWIGRLQSWLTRKFVTSFEGALEHIDTNLHAHVLIRSSEYIKKAKHFKKFPGFVKIDKIAKDNGISNYISKENKLFTSIIELKQFAESNGLLVPSQSPSASTPQASQTDDCP